MARNKTYYLGPTRRRGWTVRTVVEHGRFHAVQPGSWRGPFASPEEAQRAADERWHSFIVTFTRAGITRTWTRFGPSLAHVTDAALLALAREYPDGDYLPVLIDGVAVANADIVQPNPESRRS